MFFPKNCLEPVSNNIDEAWVGQKFPSAFLGVMLEGLAEVKISNLAGMSAGSASGRATVVF